MRIAQAGVAVELAPGATTEGLARREALLDREGAIRDKFGAYAAAKYGFFARAPYFEKDKESKPR
jgi:hypothetical protein